MPRSRAQLEQAAADAEAWLDQLDPADSTVENDDPADLRTIAAALNVAAAVEQAVGAAVAAARQKGRSWNEIARILGVSRQAAQKRYDQPAPVVAAQR